jgi:WD40 repeat protein/tRNA A-37 threonylcarbamoyl transferase component Bud32
MLAFVAKPKDNEGGPAAEGSTIRYSGIRRILEPTMADEETDRLPPQSSADDDQADATRPIAESSVPTRVRYIGDYELLQEIGRGGMGVIYKSRQVSLNRIVAVKMILSAQLASEHDIRRFRKEAEAAASLDHPSIVPVFEVGEHEGQHYFSMGFVEGTSLAAKLKDGPLPPRHAAELLALVADAVHYAHERGVIHRDLKPGNILLDKDGKPKVSDFGLAKRVTPSRAETISSGAASATSGRALELTATGQIMGTASYMPPEQASGKAKELDRPSVDVYSLGAVLYCLLTGRPPFQAASLMETLVQVVEQEPVPPRRLNSTIPKDLETICLKCLTKNPRRRYQTARELADDLRRWLSHEPIVARPVGRLQRTLLWCQRHPARAALSAAGILLVGSAFALLGVATQLSETRLQRSLAESAATREAEARRLAEQNAEHAAAAAKQEAEARRVAEGAVERETEARRIAEKAMMSERVERENAVTARRLVESIAYLGNMTLVDREWLGNNIAWANQLLDQCPEAMRDWEWYVAKQLCNPPAERVFRADGRAVTNVVASPDGTTIAAGSDDGAIRLWDVHSGRLLRSISGHSKAVSGLAFLPSGKGLLSVAKDVKLRLWAVDGQDDAIQTSALPYAATDVAVVPQGNLAAVTCADERTGDGALCLFTVGDEKLAPIFNWLTNEPYTAVGFYADGKRVFCGSGRGAIHIRNVSDRELVVSYRAPGYVSDIEFDPASSSPAICIFPSGPNSDSLYQQQAKPGIDFTIYDGAGREALQRSLDLEVFMKLVEYAKRIKPDSAIRTNMTVAATDMAISRDGTTRVFGQANGQLRFVDRDGNQSVIRGAHSRAVTSVCFLPNEERFVTAGADGSIRLWRTDNLWVWRELRGPKRPLPIPSVPSGVARAQQPVPDTRILLHVRPPVLVRPPLVSIAVAPDGSHVAATAWNGTTLTFETILWSLDRPQSPRFLAMIPSSQRGPRFAESAIGFKPLRDEQQSAPVAFASAQAEFSARVGRTLFGPIDFTLSDAIPVSPMSVAFSEDGQRVCGVLDTKGQVGIWRVRDGSRMKVLTAHTKPARCVAFSGDGLRLATGGDDRVFCVWNADSGQLLFKSPVHRGPVTTIRFSPDGKRLVSSEIADQPQITLWDAGTGAPISNFRTLHQGGLTSLAFSPDGMRIVTTGQDSVVKVYELNSGKELAALAGHAGRVHGAVYHPHGKRIATASEDGTVKLWDATTGREVFTLRAEGGPVYAVAFSRDGVRLASASADGTARIWESKPPARW